tara:strand:- start:470 stop:1021 length:552 start_codon:yes stop_codon:yes gene_type:complete
MSDFERVVDYPLATDEQNALIGDAVTFGPDGEQVNLSNFQFLETDKRRGINIQLPFRASPETGYFAMNTDYFQAAITNMRILLNTLPEERVVTAVGCNVKRFLFENKTVEWEMMLGTEIKTAISLYMPQINVTQAKVISPDTLGNPEVIDVSSMSEHTVNVEIKFNFKIAPELTSTANIQIHG